MSEYQLMAKGVFRFADGKEIKPDRSSADWQKYKEWQSAGGVALPASHIGVHDVETSRAELREEIDAYAATLYNKAIRGISPGELASWAVQLLDALAVQAAQASPFTALMPGIGATLGLPATPNSLADALGQRRGISEAAMAAKVTPKAIVFLSLLIGISGAAGAHCDAVDGLTDVRDIIVYDWRAGWPVID